MAELRERDRKRSRDDRCHVGRRRREPLTREQVTDADTCRYTLAIMTTVRLYETSGDWLYDIGLPGKSGIGGGIVTVAPGKGSLGTFAPRLDGARNSVKGQRAAEFLSRRLGFDLFASEPRV
jgi:glutaminase